MVRQKTVSYKNELGDVSVVSVGGEDRNNCLIRYVIDNKIGIIRPRVDRVKMSRKKSRAREMPKCRGMRSNKY